MEFGLFGPSELSAVERCPYYRGVRKEKFDCICLSDLVFTSSSKTACIHFETFLVSV